MVTYNQNHTAMKNYVLFLMLLGTAFLVSSCQKEVITPEPPAPTADLKTVQVSHDFNWKTYTDYKLTLNSSQGSGIVSVADPDGKVYQKVFLRRNIPFTVKFTAPTAQKSIQIVFLGQRMELNLSSANLSYSFK